MSKGDKDRTKDHKAYRNNWDKIFKKKKKKTKAKRNAKINNYAN